MAINEREKEVWDAERNQSAATMHRLLEWEAEAGRLNTLVHSLRRELEAAKNSSGRTVIQSLLTTLEHCEPFVRSSRNNFVGSRVDAMLDELLVTKSAALTALKHIT